VHGLFLSGAVVTSYRPPPPFIAGFTCLCPLRVHVTTFRSPCPFTVIRAMLNFFTGALRSSMALSFVRAFVPCPSFPCTPLGSGQGARKSVTCYWVWSAFRLPRSAMQATHDPSECCCLHVLSFGGCYPIARHTSPIKKPKSMVEASATMTRFMSYLHFTCIFTKFASITI